MHMSMRVIERCGIMNMNMNMSYAITGHLMGGAGPRPAANPQLRAEAATIKYGRWYRGLLGARAWRAHQPVAAGASPRGR